MKNVLPSRSRNKRQRITALKQTYITKQNNWETAEYLQIAKKHENNQSDDWKSTKFTSILITDLNVLCPKLFTFNSLLLQQCAQF